MINLLRNKNPFNIVLLIIYAILLKLVLFIHPQAIDISKWSEPCSLFTIHVFQKLRLANSFSFSGLSVITLLVIALYFNLIISKYKLNAKGIFLPAMFVILLGSFTPGFCQFSPALIGLIFILASLSRTFSLYKMERAASIMFDAGFFISIASLFYFPYIVFVLFLLTAFIIARPFNIKEYAVGISGIIIPYFLIGVIYYWNNSMLQYGLIYRKYFVGSFLHYIQVNIIHHSEPLIIILILFLWSSFTIIGYYSKAVMQHRIIILILYIFFCGGSISILLINNISVQHFIWLIIPVAFTTSFAIAELRKRWVGEIVHLCLILLLIYFQYFNKL